MSALSRFFPPSTYTRLIALGTAKTRNDNLTTESPLMPKTIERLNAIYPLLHERVNELNVATAQWAEQASKKAAAKTQTVMYCSHFIQVFDMGVKRGIFNPSTRILLGLSEGNARLPRMIQDREIMTVADNLIKGETIRIEKGGAPVTCPSLHELQTVFGTYKTAYFNMSNCHSRLSIKQKAVNELTKEARGVIRKVWAEVETYYDHLPHESIRNHGRLWGIVYAQKGGEKFIEGTVTNAETGLPLPQVKLKLLNGRNRTATGADGKFKLNTTLMHTQTIKAECPGFLPVEITIELTEGKNTACNLSLLPVA